MSVEAPFAHNLEKNKLDLPSTIQQFNFRVGGWFELSSNKVVSALSSTLLFVFLQPGLARQKLNATATLSLNF